MYTLAAGRATAWSGQSVASEEIQVRAEFPSDRPTGQVDPGDLEPAPGQSFSAGIGSVSPVSTITSGAARVSVSSDDVGGHNQFHEKDTAPGQRIARGPR